MLAVFLADLACDSLGRNEERQSHGNSQLSPQHYRSPQLQESKRQEEKEACPLLRCILPTGDVPAIQQQQLDKKTTEQAWAMAVTDHASSVYQKGILFSQSYILIFP